MVQRPLPSGGSGLRTTGLSPPPQKHAQSLVARFVVVRTQVGNATRFIISYRLSKFRRTFKNRFLRLWVSGFEFELPIYLYYFFVIPFLGEGCLPLVHINGHRQVENEKYNRAELNFGITIVLPRSSAM